MKTKEIVKGSAKKVMNVKKKTEKSYGLFKFLFLAGMLGFIFLCFDAPKGVLIGDHLLSFF